jgi:cytochrome c553
MSFAAAGAALVALMLCTARHRAARSQLADKGPRSPMEARVLGCVPCHGVRGQGIANRVLPAPGGQARRLLSRTS